MAEYQKTIITNAGISVLNRVLSGKATVTFTRAVSSTDDLSGKTESELRAMTGFSSVMQNGVCSRYDIHSSNMVSLDLLFTNEGLGNSYMINAVGLYAKASDSSSEILYAIARAGKDARGNSLAEQMPAYAGNLTKFTISLYTQVGQASSVSVSITDEGVVKSINGGDVTPDVNGDVTIDTSTQANALQAQLISGRLYVPVSDESGNPLRDEAGNALTAVEYLPKTVSVDGEAPISPDANNNINLPVFSKGEILRKLDGKLDEIYGKNSIDELYGISLSNHAFLIGNQIVVPLCDDEGNPLMDEAGNIIVDDVHFVMSVNGQTPGPDGAITLPDTYTKREIEQRLGVKSNYLEEEVKHANLQKQLDGHEAHLASNDSKISDTDARSKLIEATIATGYRLIPVSDESGNVLTDEAGNAITAQERELRTVQGKEPDSSGNINLDVYSKKEINNKIDGLQEQIAFLMSKINKE